MIKFSCNSMKIWERFFLKLIHLRKMKPVFMGENKV